MPALMVVPGPHLINGLLDLIDNHLPMSIARLGLAAGILLSATVGVLMGMQLALPSEVLAARGSDVETPGLIVVMILAGVVTCGFAVFYNATWSQAALAVLGGMAGNGLRDIALDTGVPLDASTFLGGLAVGTVSAAITRSTRIPVAVVGFAGAVTMMPGIHIYQAIGGILRFARLSDASNITVTMELATKLVAVCVVVGALTLGLLIGARIGLALSRRAT